MLIFISGHTCIGKTSLIKRITDHYTSLGREVIKVGTTPRSAELTEDDFDKITFNNGDYLNLLKDDVVLSLLEGGVKVLKDTVDLTDTNKIYISDRSVLDAVAYKFIYKHFNPNYNLRLFNDSIKSIMDEVYEYYDKSLIFCMDMTVPDWFRLYSEHRKDDKLFSSLRYPYDINKLFYNYFMEASRFHSDDNFRTFRVPNTLINPNIAYDTVIKYITIYDRPTESDK